MRSGALASGLPPRPRNGANGGGNPRDHPVGPCNPLAAPKLSRLKSTFGPCLLANHPVNKYSTRSGQPQTGSSRAAVSRRRAPAASTLPEAVRGRCAVPQSGATSGRRSSRHRYATIRKIVQVTTLTPSPRPGNQRHLHVRFDERRLETESRGGVRHRHRRKPPGTATPSAYRHRASRRLYPSPANNPNPGALLGRGERMGPVR